MKSFLKLLLIMLFLSGMSFAQETPDYKALKERGVLFYTQNSIDAALESFLKIPEASRDAEVYLLMANIYQDKNDPLESVIYLKKSAVKNPKYFKAYYNLGNLYLEDMKFNQASENFKKTIALKKDFSYAYYNLGTCYFLQGQYKKAKKQFLQATLLKPDEPDFYYNLSLAYKALKDEKRAKLTMEAYDKVVNFAR